MYICNCNGVTYSEVKEVIDKRNPKDLEELQKHIMVANCCAMCECDIENIIEQHKK